MPSKSRNGLKLVNQSNVTTSESSKLLQTIEEKRQLQNVKAKANSNNIMISSHRFMSSLDLM